MVEKVKQSPRARAPKSYGQFCALARALDVVGERWTLLIVRELLPGPMRYTELRTSLGGIATNLLADRLRTMETSGLVERRAEASGLVYALTPRGRELRTAMEALGRWGAPLLESGRGEDAFEPRWLTLALPALLRDVTASPPLELGLAVEGMLLRLRVDEDGVTAAVPDPDDEPPASVLTAPADVIAALASGAIPPEQAVAAGEFRGDRRVLATVFAAGDDHS